MAALRVKLNVVNVVDRGRPARKQPLVLCCAFVVGGSARPSDVGHSFSPSEGAKRAGIYATAVSINTFTAHNISFS